MKRLFIIFMAIAELYALTITPDNSNIRYNGVVESEITATEAKLYRLKKFYIDAEFSYKRGAWSQENAGTQTGITVQVRTASPTVTFNFDIDPTYTDRWARMAIYRNDILIDSVQGGVGVGLSVTGTTSATDTAVWTCVLPSYKAQIFKGVEISDGYSIVPFEVDTRPVYVAIGNSITHGSGQYAAAGYRTYPFLIAQAKGYHLYNMGVGGSRVNTQIVENMEGLEPAVITLLWGYNDVNSIFDLDTAEINYRNLLTSLVTKYPNTQIYTILQTTTTTTIGAQVSTNSIERLRRDQRAIIEEIQLNNPNVFMLDGADFTTLEDLHDAVHLNDQGAAKLGQALIDAINKNEEEIVQLPIIQQKVKDQNFTFEGLSIRSEENIRVNLYSLNGRTIYSSQKSNSIELPKLISEGIYFIEIRGESFHQNLKVQFKGNSQNYILSY